MRNRHYLCILFFIPSISSALDCPATPHRTTGTHYKPVTEHKLNIGTGVKMTGRILEATTCKPVEHARVAHWQAGKNGHYQDALRAYLFTNREGEFEFNTEWPALPVPHIHFIISAEGYEQLETQWRGDTPLEHIHFDMFIKKQKQ
jgi:protocatechuate 3,4-dioxygenase beta subunit